MHLKDVCYVDRNDVVVSLAMETIGGRCHLAVGECQRQRGAGATSEDGHLLVQAAGKYGAVG